MAADFPRSRTLDLAGLVLFALCLPLTALAQSAPGEPKAMSANPQAPDVVRLKNGGLLRGTISELVPGVSVVLVTATGEVRRFPMAEVDFAGPATELPGARAAAAPTASAAAADGRATVSLRSSRPEVTFHQRIASGVTTGGSVGFGVGIGGGGGGGGGVSMSPFAAHSVTYAPLCLAPCELAMAPGTYYLGLSLADGSPISNNRPIVIGPGSTEVRGDYESYAPVRTAGWIVGGATFLAGASLSVWALATGVEQCSAPNSNCVVPENRTVPLVTGVAILIGGGIVGYILSSVEDDVSVSVN